MDRSVVLFFFRAKRLIAIRKRKWLSSASLQCSSPCSCVTRAPYASHSFHWFLSSRDTREILIALWLMLSTESSNRGEGTPDKHVSSCNYFHEFDAVVSLALCVMHLILHSFGWRSESFKVMYLYIVFSRIIIIKLR